MREKLLENHRKFYKDVAALADKHAVKAYVITEPDEQRTALGIHPDPLPDIR